MEEKWLESIHSIRAARRDSSLVLASQICRVDLVSVPLELWFLMKNIFIFYVLL